MKSCLTTLCYLQKEDSYLMLHREVKEETGLTLKLCYEKDKLVEAVLDGKIITEW